MTAQELLRQHGIDYIETRKGSYTTTCPNCAGGYLNVEIKRDGAVWFCHACGEGGGDKFEKPDSSGGLGPIKAIYDYTDEAGQRLFQVLRFEPLNAPKQFRQRTGPDQEKWSIKGVRIVPFMLPDLIEAIAHDQVVFICEGEKDVLRLHGEHIPATCNPMGAGKWWPEFNEVLRGADVVICVDNDQPGRAHGRLVADNLVPVVKRLRVLDLAKIWPDIEPSDDVTDWFERGGGTVERLWEIVEQLPDWTPPMAGNGQKHVATPDLDEQRADKPSPLFDPWEKYIVPEFPLEVLPPIAQDYVAAQSTVMGCCASGLAMAVLAVFSGALHHGFAVKMMRNGAWQERPRLWVLLVADPSQRKTPIMNAASAPLAHYETHLRVKYEADLRDYETALAQMGQDDQEPRKPDPPPRYIVWDTTVEKLGELLARSPKGLLVKSDEISGWLGNMERYSAGRSDRGFWLCAYDGGPHSIDRIKRGEMFIKNLSVSLLGGIQPARLAELQGLTSDGLLQRFLLVMMGSASLPQDAPSDDERYGALVRELIFAKPARLIMSDAALAVMAELRQHLFNLEQASGGLAPGFQSLADGLFVRRA